MARQIADNSIVLLKNDNVTGSDHPLLPVDAARLKNVVIVGNLANTVTLGGYSGDPSLQVNAVQGIEAAVRAANPDAVVTFDACGTSTTSTNAASCSAATTAAMKTADLVIAFVGTDLNIASEGRDRGNIAMPGNYSSLLSQVTASGNPNTALVIQSNGPVDISSVQSSFPAIVFSGYNGESQGSALADVLTGAQNPSGHLDLALTGPTVWTVAATTPATFASVAAGQAATTTWKVTVPSTAKSGSNELDATASFTDANGQSTVADAAQVSIPYDSLAAAFDNPGISDDANPGAGNLDGGGNSYSAQALAAANPAVTPAATITHDGLTFTWPNAAPGTDGNVVAGGQTFAFSGSGNTLGFLGTGDYGAASGTGTITYTDGSTQSFALGFADWWSNAAVAGGDILTSAAYINGPGGRQNQQVSVYYYPVSLQAGKTVQYITLPNVSQGANVGSTAMHVFAVAIG